MVEAINPVTANMRLAQLLGEDDLMAQAPGRADTYVARAGGGFAGQIHRQCL